MQKTYEEIVNTVICGNALDIIPTLPKESIQTCITSPPYYGLRDYGTSSWDGGDPDCEHRTMRDRRSDNSKKQKTNRGNVVGSMEIKVGQQCPLCGALRIDSQIGLEKTMYDYIDNLTLVFQYIKEIMKDNGTLWLNLGDSYANSGQINSDGRRGFSGKKGDGIMNKTIKGLHPKNLLGIPWKVAFALQRSGWILRQEIIWNKSNPMPSSVTDRPTRSHEQIFLFSKSPHYYYDCDAIREKYLTVDKKYNTNKKGKNKRSVWTTSIGVNPSAHHAVFPEKLIIPCIQAGCPEGGLVLDPFFGSGTTGIVSRKLGRNWVGIELNPKFAEFAQSRFVQRELF